ncbi:MAG: class I SAM-dependent methyltransferase [Pseudomonadota bacterium]
MLAPDRISGSFRDPAGHVFRSGGRIFRTVTDCAVDDYEHVRDAGLFKKLAEDELITQAVEVDPDLLGETGSNTQYLLEHPKIPFITFPYEWSFSALKAAAKHHLNLHLRLLEHDVTLSDASAYNIQFVGAKPVFIDTLSLRRYREGEYWLGHRQFSEQFVNPLLLRAHLGIAHNAWYRGSLEGIANTELSSVLPMRSKLSWRVASQVVLPAMLQRRAVNAPDQSLAKMPERRLAKSGFQAMLRQLKTWIEKLHPADVGKTVWQDYAENHSYDDPEEQAKHAFVADFVGAAKPNLLFDFGCNTGAYSALALKSGADTVIGFDMDQGALERAFARAEADDLAFLPLYLDAANPSPAQGWRQAERPGLADRAPADGLLALAFIHHLAIARNIPLDQLLDWLTGLAPRGVIEFVPKNDPTVQRMLALRDDVFSDYDVSTFADLLNERATIVRRDVVSAAGRELFWYSTD